MDSACSILVTGGKVVKIIYRQRGRGKTSYRVSVPSPLEFVRHGERRVSAVVKWRVTHVQ